MIQQTIHQFRAISRTCSAMIYHSYVISWKAEVIVTPADATVVIFAPDNEARRSRHVDSELDF